MTIWKFPLNTTDDAHVVVPRDAKLLCVQLQRGIPTLWVMVHEEGELCDRKIVTVATGEAFGVLGPYVGTYQLAASGTVWHVFDGGEK